MASRSHAPTFIALARAFVLVVLSVPVAATASVEAVASVEAAAKAPVAASGAAAVDARSVTPADASGAAQGTPMAAALRDELVAAALEFSDRPRPSAPVPVTLALPAAAFAREVCRDANIPCDNVMAAYDAARVRVLYRAELDLTKVWERSFVVHELVHWLQHQAQPDTQADANCQAYRAAEREAYTVQNRYLRHHQSGRRAGTMLAMLHC